MDRPSPTSYRRSADSAFVDFEQGTVDLFLTHEDSYIDSIEVTGMQSV